MLKYGLNLTTKYIIIILSLILDVNLFRYLRLTGNSFFKYLNYNWEV